MEPGRVVVLAEGFNDHPGLGQGPALLPVEAFVAGATVEAFDEAVIPGTGRGDVDGLDVLLCQSALEVMGDKLRAVVGTDKFQVPRGRQWPS